jgi:hypothetical protein
MLASEARGAWQDIEQRLRPYVARRVASPCDIEDVLQEIFVRIHRGLSALRDGESFGGWVYRIAQSCIADAARAREAHWSSWTRPPRWPSRPPMIVTTSKAISARASRCSSRVCRHPTARAKPLGARGAGGPGTAPPEGPRNDPSPKPIGYGRPGARAGEPGHGVDSAR